MNDTQKAEYRYAVNYWYSYDPEDGYTRHSTASEAESAAEASLDYERERSPDSWNESTSEIEDSCAEET